MTNTLPLTAIPLGQRVTAGFPCRQTVGPDSSLKERFSHLRHVESELALHSTHADLNSDLIRQANAVFGPFGKFVQFAVIKRNELYTTFEADPRVGRTGTTRVGNFPPQNYPEEEILRQAAGENTIIHKIDGTIQYVALPLAREGHPCGMMLLSNRNTRRPFTNEDIAVAVEFTLIASEALTALSRRLSAC